MVGREGKWNELSCVPSGSAPSLIRTFLLQIGAESLGNVCKVCGKVFIGRNWKQNIEYHFLTHTKEKPFKCPICLHRSALKYNLIRHIRNRHRDLLASPCQGHSGATGNTKVLAETNSQGTSYQAAQHRQDRDASCGQDTATATATTLQFALDQGHSGQGSRLPPCSDVQITPTSEVHPTTSHKQSPLQDNSSSLMANQKAPASVNQVNPLSTCQSITPSQCGQKAVSVVQAMGFLSGEALNSDHGASRLGAPYHQHLPSAAGLVKQHDTHTFPSQEMNILQSHDLQLSID